MSNILRLKYDLGGEDYLGAIYSDREESSDSSKAFGLSGYNRNFGFDGKFNFASYYYLIFQLLGTSTKEINDTAFNYNTLKKYRFDNNKYTALLDGKKFNGADAFVSFSRNTRAWNFYSEYFFQSPTVRRDNGFIQYNNFHNLYFQNDYNFYPETKLLHRLNPEVNMEIKFDAQRKLREQFVDLNPIVEFNGGIKIYGGYIVVNNENYGGIFHKDVNRWHFNLEAFNLSKFLTGSFSLEWGKYIVRFESPSYVGYGSNFSLSATVKPFDRLRNDINYSYSELARSKGGEKLFAGYVLSNKISYQFNKNFFLRVLLQYDQFNRDFSIDPLFSYKWNPYTILFIGSSHDLNELTNSTGITNFMKQTDRYF